MSLRTNPFIDMLVVTPSDSTVYPNAAQNVQPKGFYVGGAGNVSFVTRGGRTVTLPFQAGAVLPCEVMQILATGTTATNIAIGW